MKRVLVIRFSSLGDVLLTLPSVRWLVQNGHEVHFLTKEAFRPVLELMGADVRIHTITNHATAKELKSVTKGLRKIAFDQVYDLHRNLRSFLVTFYLRVPYRRVSKHRFKETFLFLLRRRIYSLFFEDLNRREESLRLVSGRIESPKQNTDSALLKPEIDLKLPPADKTRRVCLALESAWHQKEWSIERFADIARQLVRNGYQVVWLGLRPLPAMAKIEGAIDLTERLAIKEVASVLAAAQVLVSNDSGLMHLAESVGTPAVAVFGPTSRELGFSPSMPQSRLVEADLWCRPCSKTGRWCIRPFDRQKCLKAVSVGDVMTAIDSVLSRPESGARK